MKKSLLIMLASIFFTTFAFAGGDQNQNRYDGVIGEGPTQQRRIAEPNKDALQVSQLDESQKNIIYSIYEEEKVARDVYITLGEIYPEENTFANIQLAEQTHMDAVRNLCVKYGIEIPDVDQDVGVFHLEEMELLYNGFVDDELTSLILALEAGKAIEERDMADLAEALLLDLPKDVEKVFTNLMRGSTYHLEAFIQALDRETLP